MPLVSVATYLGKSEEWPDDVMLAGMQEHYPDIELTDIVQVVEYEPFKLDVDGGQLANGGGPLAPDPDIRDHMAAGQKRVTIGLCLSPHCRRASALAYEAICNQS